MISRLRTFLSRPDGAATVNWVVISALIIGLSMIVVSQIVAGTGGVAGRVAAALSAFADSSDE